MVAFFISTSLGADAIKKALHQVKTWSPDLNPVYSMTDNDSAEIKALKETFSSIKETFYCDFHVKQAWRCHVKSIQSNSNCKGVLKLPMYLLIYCLVLVTKK